MKNDIDFTKPYFIAEIGGNHDGEINRAIKLIQLAAQNGAHAVKFQNFSGNSLFNFEAYSELATKFSPHKRSIDEIKQLIDKYTVPAEWFKKLRRVCDEQNVDLITAPYDIESIADVDLYVDAFKIGSGDLTWHEKAIILQNTGKPLILSTGASKFVEVESLIRKLDLSKKIAVLQCTSNYEGGDQNLQHTNLNVLKKYKKCWPEVDFGISDHQKSIIPIIGSIILGGNVIERHFTDDNNRNGADHGVALLPSEWSDMVIAGNLAHTSLGSENKIVELCENGTRMTQRRSLWFKRDMHQNEIITREDIEVLRPNTGKGFGADEIDQVVGKTISCSVKKRDLIFDAHLR
ncbi:N-acetylneuraminate synthase family protein [Gammaproteobacteria bacterium]|nr:N-acetylneuraminate synthase family protein [Gammaproteobacteria bacterium]